MGCGWSEINGEVKVSGPKTMTGNGADKNELDKASNNSSKIGTRGSSSFDEENPEMNSNNLEELPKKEGEEAGTKSAEKNNEEGKKHLNEPVKKKRMIKQTVQKEVNDEKIEEEDKNAKRDEREKVKLQVEGQGQYEGEGSQQNDPNELSNSRYFVGEKVKISKLYGGVENGISNEFVTEKREEERIENNFEVQLLLPNFNNQFPSVYDGWIRGQARVDEGQRNQNSEDHGVSIVDREDIESESSSEQVQDMRSIPRRLIIERQEEIENSEIDRESIAEREDMNDENSNK